MAEANEEQVHAEFGPKVAEALDGRALVAVDYLRFRLADNTPLTGKQADAAAKAGAFVRGPFQGGLVFRWCEALNRWEWWDAQVHAWVFTSWAPSEYSGGSWWLAEDPAALHARLVWGGSVEVSAPPMPPDFKLALELHPGQSVIINGEEWVPKRACASDGEGAIEPKVGKDVREWLHWYGYRGEQSPGREALVVGRMRLRWNHLRKTFERHNLQEWVPTCIWDDEQAVPASGTWVHA